MPGAAGLGGLGQRSGIEARPQDRLDPRVRACPDDQRAIARGFDAFDAVALDQSHDVQARSVAVLGVFALGEDRLGERAGVEPVLPARAVIRSGGHSACLRYETGMRSGLVVKPPCWRPAHVRGDALAQVEHLAAGADGFLDASRWQRLRYWLTMEEGEGRCVMLRAWGRRTRTEERSAASPRPRRTVP